MNLALFQHGRRLPVICLSRDRQLCEDMADEKDVAEKTIAEDAVVNKYKMGGEIVNSKLIH